MRAVADLRIFFCFFLFFGSRRRRKSNNRNLSYIYLCAVKHQLNIMATIATNKLWAYIESLSLSRRDRNWLAGKLLEPSFQTDPYEVSPSGDSFFADSRNVKAVEHDIAEAHRSGAKFTRLENKEDIMAMINDL